MGEQSTLQGLIESSSTALEQGRGAARANSKVLQGARPNESPTGGLQPVTNSQLHSSFTLGRVEFGIAAVAGIVRCGLRGGETAILRSWTRAAIGIEIRICWL